MALRSPARRSAVLRCAGGLAVSAALLGVLPGQALAAAPPTPEPAPPTVVAPVPGPATTPGQPAEVATPAPEAPGQEAPGPQVTRVPEGAPATGGGSTERQDAALTTAGVLGLAGAAGAAGAALARRRRFSTRA